MKPSYPMTVFYDADCPVCAFEMDHLRELDRASRLVFVDIGAPGFDPAVCGATVEQMGAEIHARLPDGQVIRGLEVLRLAYAAVGLGWVLRPTGWGPMRPLFDRAYRVFARYRRPISRASAPLIESIRMLRARHVARRMARCNGSSCAPNAAVFSTRGTKDPS